MKIKSIEHLEHIRNIGIESLTPSKPKIMVGMATCGIATGAGEVYETILSEVKKRGLNIVVSKTGCIGWCCKEPIVDILEPGRPRISYGEISTKKVSELINMLMEKKIKHDWVLYKMETESEKAEEMTKIPSYKKIDFYRKQQKIAMRNCGFIDPEKIEEYIARGGYYSLYKVLKEMNPEDVIEEVTKSGLRGRGGAGFPTGLKWRITRENEGTMKYIICNADEGDPGAYMDRSILEGDPHSVIEGMIIGSYAIGAREGYIYVRAEYPLAVEKLTIAIKQAEKYGLLGKKIMGSNFDLTIRLNMGAGAFVCGEETALIASIQGRRGMPRARPPFPAESGLWGKPTNINNVETWANIPVIVTKGGNWFSKIGTEKSKGTKVFSLVGKINNTGLVEVPMGITLKEIVYDIGGGIPGGKKFKAVQTGGPSGGCIPESLIDNPVDYEELAKTGSIMGSGGMIVMDEETCMVDVAKYFVSFLEDESCGKCLPCREGIERMREVLERITEGKGKKEDIELLEDLSEVVKEASLCGLGQTAPNPVLTTFRYFRDEYEAHINEKRCPAGVCKALIKYLIDSDKCNGCTRCTMECPQDAILGEKKKPHNIIQEKCIKCGACYEVCNFEAIIIE